MSRYVFQKLQYIRPCYFNLLNISTSGNICRRSSTNVKPIPNPAILNILSAKDMSEFDSYYPVIFSEVVDDKLVSPIPKVNEELGKILNYNVPTGRKLRPYLMIATYKYLTSNEIPTPEKMKMMNILAWFVELINAAFVIQDDVADNSETRRGKPTWFKCVGTKAQNDSLLLGAVSLQLLKKYFSSHRNYWRMIDIYIEMMRITEVGLALEAVTTLNEFTERRYYEIAKQKMGFYLFNFTTTIATLLADKEDLMISDTAGNFFNELAVLYTIQNDYMDCYGEHVTGKQGADIQEGQCTWLIISALEKATPRQKKILQKCYGSYEQKDVDAIKQIYRELDIRNQYEATVQHCFQKASSEIDSIQNNSVRKFCEMLLKIFFRLE